jgi:asparagine synthase (glutamine-hydrolysing)
MCGITGLLTASPGSELELKVLVSRMAGQLAHRGPDDSGVWVDQQAGIAFGHRRLAIVDLSPDGHQPMHSESGRYVIVFNGEVYNFIDLHQELETLGHTFRGHSDTEVMLAAMEQWGIEESLKRFNGMFAFAVWDRQERRLHLVRDRLGEKPLYYGWMGKSFMFGSELKALVVHPEFSREIDRNTLPMYLRHSCIPTPYSIYRGIHKLPPAARVTVGLCDEGNRPAPVSYWSAEEAARRGMEDPFTGSAEEAVDHLDELLGHAVRMRMVADVPLGAFLSGGVDSSTLVALMQGQSARSVKTFSIGFHEGGYNEAPHAAAVAHYLGTDHTEFYVSPAEAMPVIPRLPTFYDEPFSDSSQIPTYLLSALTRMHVTVSLSGDGGDELFGGYRRYFVWGRIWDKVGWLPQVVRQAVSRGLLSLTAPKWNQLASFVSPIVSSIALINSPGDKVHRLGLILSARDSFSRYRAVVSAWESPGSILQGVQEPQNLHRDRCQGPEIPGFCRHMMFLDAVTYLPDDILVKVDRATMAASLEARAPYLDHRVVEFAARLPLSMKLRHGEGKWLLRRVLDRYVPKPLIERPKKGFALPIAEWLRGPLREWAEELLHEDRLRREGYFDLNSVRELWSQHLSGQRDLRHTLWSLLMFQAWLERWRKPAFESEGVPETQWLAASG